MYRHNPSSQPLLLSRKVNECEHFKQLVEREMCCGEGWAVRNSLSFFRHAGLRPYGYACPFYMCARKKGVQLLSRWGKGEKRKEENKKKFHSSVFTYTRWDAKVSVTCVASTIVTNNEHTHGTRGYLWTKIIKRTRCSFISLLLF